VIESGDLLDVSKVIHHMDDYTIDMQIAKNWLNMLITGIIHVQVRYRRD